MRNTRNGQPIETFEELIDKLNKDKQDAFEAMRVIDRAQSERRAAITDLDRRTQDIRAIVTRSEAERDALMREIEDIENTLHRVSPLIEKPQETPGEEEETDGDKAPDGAETPPTEATDDSQDNPDEVGNEEPDVKDSNDPVQG